MRSLLRRFCHDGGHAALEFALILPVLLTLIGGIIEYGRVLFAQNAVRAIIDENTRHAVVRALSVAEVENAVDEQVGEVPGIESYEVAVTDGCAFTVTVSGSFSFIFVGFLPGDLRDALGFSLTARYPKC